MKRLMLDHVFRFVRTVLLLVDEQNLRSPRAIEKIGGRLVGSFVGASGRTALRYEITFDHA